MNSSFQAKTANCAKTLFSAAFSMFFAIQSASAFETINLKTKKERANSRVAVIVLAYNSDFGSYAGEFLYDGYLRLLMAKRYDTLFVSRDTQKGLSETDIQTAFKAALDTGNKVDFMSSTHSNGSIIQITSGKKIKPYDLLAPVLTAENISQLEFAATFGCDSAPHWSQFESLGFKSFAGHEGISIGAVAMHYFLRAALVKCQSLNDAVATTNSKIEKLFKNNPITQWIYKKLAKEESYSAELLAFGENFSACSRN